MNRQALDQKTVKELRALAKKHGVAGASRLRKAELVQAITRSEANMPRGMMAPKTRMRGGGLPSESKVARVLTTVLDSGEPEPGRAPSPSAIRETEPQREVPWHAPEPEATAPHPCPSPETEPLQHSRAVLLVQDPHWLHAYWEIAQASLDQARDALSEEWERSRRVLRVTDFGPVSGNGGPRQHDREVHEFSQNHYFESEPDHSYQFILGYLAPSGRFFAIAESNRVRTPRAGMSEVIDPKWRTLRSESDYEKLYALSGGFRVGAGSLELREQLERFLEQAITSGSGGISSFGSQFGREQARERGFWFNLDCELIVYGATEPDATVTVQGQPVLLRPDGTFTLRFALPDGEQIIDATAHSADGVEERTITPTVKRKTEVLEPVLKK